MPEEIFPIHIMDGKEFKLSRFGFRGAEYHSEHSLLSRLQEIRELIEGKIHLIVMLVDSNDRYMEPTQPTNKKYRELFSKVENVSIAFDIPFDPNIHDIETFAADFYKNKENELVSWNPVSERAKKRPEL